MTFVCWFICRIASVGHNFSPIGHSASAGKGGWANGMDWQKQEPKKEVFCDHTTMIAPTAVILPKKSTVQAILRLAQNGISHKLRKRRIQYRR